MKALLLAMAALFAVGGTSLSVDPVKKVERALALTVLGMDEAQKIVHERILEVRGQISTLVDGNVEVLASFDRLSSAWEIYFNDNRNFDFESLLYASLFATEKHKGEKYILHTEAPFVIKSFKTAENLWFIGNERQVNLLVSALLQDTLDRGEGLEKVIEAHFGENVVHTIKEISPLPNLSDAENKEKRLDKISELSLDAATITLATVLYDLKELNHMEFKLKPSEMLHQKIRAEVLYEKRIFIPLQGTNPDLESAIEKELHCWE